MIKITKDLNEAKYVTHAGNFHADDVFSATFLNKLKGDITLIRVKEYIDNDPEKLAFDIGLGKFDHHQKNAQKQDNGLTYCSFGLLWQEFGRDYLKQINVSNIEDTFQVFDYLLVQDINAFDNGEFEINSDFNIYTIPSFIETFRAKDDEDEDTCFLEATSIASFLFDKIMNEAISKVNIIEKIQNLSSNIKDKVLILDEYIPYEYAIFYLKLDVDFVIYPSNRGGYAAHTIPTHYKGFTSKIPFKSEWAGLRDKEFQDISGVDTARFCHNKLFLVTADTLEDAKQLVYLTLNETKK